MINEQDFALYMKVYSEFPQTLKHPNVIVFLKSDVNTNYERIQRRARDYETGTIDLNYLNSLKVQYEQFERVLLSDHSDIRLIQIVTDQLGADEVFEIVIRELKDLVN